MSAALSAEAAPCEVRLPGGVLLVAPLRAFGAGAAGASQPAASARLRRMLGHPEAFARLRADWDGLRLGGDPVRMAPAAIVSALDAAVAAGRLGVVWLPESTDPMDRPGLSQVPPGAAVAAAAPQRAVRDMTRAERIEATLKRVPNYLTGDLKEAFLGLISPTSIAVTVGAFVALAVGHFFGYGEAVDAALAVIAYAIAGLSGLRALYDMVAATIDAATAGSDADIESAARRLAGAFVVLGMAFLTIFIARAARKAARTRASANPAADEPGQGGSGGGGRSSGGGGSSSERRPVAPVRTGPLYDDPAGVVRQRTQELADQIPENTRGRITMGVGVVQDASGERSILVSTSEPRGYLRPGVTLDPGETMVAGTGHAEADIAQYAADNNLSLVAVGATRPVCAACQSVLGPTGADIATPLK